MTNKALKEIMQVHYAMRQQNICCTDFTLTKRMLLQIDQNKSNNTEDVKQENCHISGFILPCLS